MKTILKICLGVCFFLVSYSIQAQTTTQKTTQTVKKDAKKVGNKTAELASKGKASITDQVYKDKVGPDGQTIYIDNHSRYYWVDRKGHKNYVTTDQLKDKIRR